MSKIEKIARKGWTITEVRFDKYQNFWYCGASHDVVGDVDGCGVSMAIAISELCSNADKATPAWYLENLEKV